MQAIVRVVVVNFNSGHHLRRCLECLSRQTEARLEAVIVDNGSSDGSFDGLPSDSRFRLVRLGSNVGFAHR